MRKKSVASEGGGDVQGRKGVNLPFFELQNPDFAWKFIWTVPTNYEKIVKVAQKMAAIGRQLLVQKRNKSKNTFTPAISTSHLFY